MAEDESVVLEKLLEIDKRLDYMESRLSSVEQGQGPQAVSTSGKSREDIVRNNIDTYINQNSHIPKIQLKNKLLEAGYTSQEIENNPTYISQNTHSIATPWSSGTTNNTNTPRFISTETSSPATNDRESFEVQLGTKWFSRIGITALVIGVALFLMYSLQYFGALGKIGIGILSAATLMGAGFYLEKKYQLYGQIIFAGGVALLYFTTYASYFFDASKVMDSQGLNLIMLVIISLLYLVYSLRYNSQSMTGVALSLVYITTNLGDLSQFSLIMLTGVLTIAIGLAAWKGWKFLLFGSLIASYMTFSRWVAFSGVSAEITQGTFFFAASIATFCYLLYTLGGYFIYKKENDEKNMESVALIGLNTFLYFPQILTLYAMIYDDKKALIWLFFSIFNIILAVVFRFGASMKYAARTYLTVATVSLLIFIPICFTGYGAYLAWLALGLVFISYGIYKGTMRTRIVGLLIMLLAFARLIALNAGTVPLEQNILFFSLFCLSTEIISLVMLRTQLNRGENDDPRNDNTVQGVYSFLSVISLTMLLGYVVTGNLLTLSWGVAGFMIPLIGFAVSDKYFRRAGLGLLLLTILKLFLVDMSSMETVFKIISFIGLGAVLLLISFGYTKYKDEIGKYL